MFAQLLWWIKWAMQGLFWHNFFVLTGLTVSPSNNSTLPGESPPNIHWDNFTVASAEFAWLCMSAMVLTALLARRRSYELFLYTHHLAVGVFITTIVHAWCAWYFLMPPLLFWLLDKALRMSRTKGMSMS